MGTYLGREEKQKKTIAMVDAYRNRREENVEQEGKNEQTFGFINQVIPLGHESLSAVFLPQAM